MVVVDAIETVRSCFESGLTRSLDWRKRQLSNLESLITENRDALCEALASDLGKPHLESWGTDLHPALAHTRFLRKNIDSWAKPQKVRLPLLGQPAKAYTVAEPLGVCLIMSPWNYPILVTLTPLASALAAGNTAVVKPSELSPTTSELLGSLATSYLDDEAVQFCQGGSEVAEELLRHRFDHIFFTGSSRVGRIVAQAAAASLTPLTLELGGKSPTYVDRSADISAAAKRIAWGKFLNAGQSCIAPDYVLVHGDVREHFIDELATTVDSFFGNDARTSSDFGRIVSPTHFERLESMITAEDCGDVVVGGSVDCEARYVDPTVLVEPAPTSKVMTDEVFGPILPVLSVPSVSEAVAFIKGKPKPLALYLFATDQSVKASILNQTSSGTVLINHTMFQIAMPDLPFGGVGDSGYGRNHGRRGFETFSNIKSVMHKPSGYELDVIYPPTSKFKKSVLKRLLR